MTGLLLRPTTYCASILLLSGLILFCAPQRGFANHVVMHGGPFLGVIVSIVVDPVDPNFVFLASYGGGVFRSLDGGRSWTATNEGLPDRQIFTLAVDPRDSRIVYAGTDQGVYWSQDRGASWSELTAVLRKRNVRSLAVVPGDATTLYVATDRGVFRGLKNKWTSLAADLPSRDVRAIAAAPDGTVYAGTFGGIFRRDANRTAWVAAHEGLVDKKVRALGLDPAKPRTLYAGAAVGGAFKSLDGGRSWKPANKGLLNSSVLALAVTPKRGPVYAATVDGVFKSTDGALSWFATDSSLAMTTATVAFDPQNPLVLYAGSGGHLFTSLNGGDQWQEISHHQVHYFGPAVRALSGAAAAPTLMRKEVTK